MPEPAVAEFVIQGLTQDGKPFRPSDWAERLCGVMSAFGGDHRMQYSPFVHPVTANGERRFLVARGYRLGDFLDRAAHAGAKRHVVLAALERLLGALAHGFDVGHVVALPKRGRILA